MMPSSPTTGVSSQQTQQEDSGRLLTSLLQWEARAQDEEEETLSLHITTRTDQDDGNDVDSVFSSLLICFSPSQDDSSASPRATPVLMEKDEDDGDDTEENVIDDPNHQGRNDYKVRGRKRNSESEETSFAPSQQHEQHQHEQKKEVYRETLLQRASRCNTRIKIAEWLYRVIDHCGEVTTISRDAVYLSMKLFDRVLDYYYHRHPDNDEDTRRFLQLTSLTCLYVGVKMYYFSFPLCERFLTNQHKTSTDNSINENEQEQKVVSPRDPEVEEHSKLWEQFSSENCSILSMEYLLRNYSSDQSIKIDHLKRMEAFVMERILSNQRILLFCPSTPGHFVKVLLRSIDWSSSLTEDLIQSVCTNGGEKMSSLSKVKEDIYQHSLYLCELAICDPFFSSSHACKSESQVTSPLRGRMILASELALSAVLVSGDLIFHSSSNCQALNKGQASSSKTMSLLKPTLKKHFVLTKDKKKQLSSVCQRLLELNDNSASGIHRSNTRSSTSSTSTNAVPAEEDNKQEPPQQMITSNDGNNPTTSFSHVILPCDDNAPE